MRTGLALAFLAWGAATSHAQTETIPVDHHLRSIPENLSWGWFPIDKKPVLTVRPGETVRIDTLTHAGSTQDEHPVEYLRGLGIPREEILQDVLDFWASRGGRPREGRSGHVITGPIEIEGAEPGDMLEIEILAMETRVPWASTTRAARAAYSPRGIPAFVPAIPCSTSRRARGT
jgi:hypothetical protein